MQIMETLARVELTDGLTLSQLVGETMDRMPRDATIIAILPKVTAETAITLAPHSPQNRNPSGFSKPQAGQPEGRRCPQPPQKRSPGGLSKRQWGHSTRAF